MAKRKQRSPYKTPPKKELEPLDVTLKGLRGTHPADLPESMEERLVKKLGRTSTGTLIDQDLPYLEQYMHPDSPILEDQPDRPTIKGTGKYDNLPYKKTNKYTDYDYSDKSYADAYKSVQEGKSINPWPHKGDADWQMVPNLSGLGRHTFDTSNPDYNSVYDVWDFDTTSPLVYQRGSKSILPDLSGLKSDLAKKFLQRVGKPFAVYERFPKNKDDVRAIKSIPVKK